MRSEYWLRLWRRGVSKRHRGAGLQSCDAQQQYRRSHGSKRSARDRTTSAQEHGRGRIRTPKTMRARVSIVRGLRTRRRGGGSERSSHSSRNDESGRSARDSQHGEASRSEHRGSEDADLKEREYRDEQGNVRHHTGTYYGAAQGRAEQPARQEVTLAPEGSRLAGSLRPAAERHGRGAIGDLSLAVRARR
jgi:hypothetical protein